MKTSGYFVPTRVSWRRGSTIAFALLLAAVVALFAPGASAQQLTGTISGTVYDQSGAVVPKAKIIFKNQLSGDVRTATSEDDGHFVITAVQPATYSIEVSATGFSSWQENDVVMGVGDTRDVPNIKLQIGGNSTQINVVAGADAVVPTDTAEISTSLNEQMINDFPLQGRDAGELLKIMPGMGLNVGSGQGTNFDRIVGSNNGPVGDYSSNGTQPNGAMAFMLDGANLVDPGNFGTQIANINQDMVANVKVLMSNYGAEYAKGPTIFQAFSKSGGQQFHGEGYLYTHNATLNAVDAYTKSQGGNNAAQSYYYAGGNVGGPVLLPFVKFNKDRKKLFFWAGYEYMKQQPAGSIDNFNTPNSCQLQGDFSNSVCTVPAGALSAWNNFYRPLSNDIPVGATGTSLPTALFDPNIAGILKLYPQNNQAPTAANGYNNYRYVNTSPQNRWEATGKVDYAISDNDKVTGSYAYQKEADLAPISIWWAPPYTLPYPTPAASQTVTYIILTNYTHVFSPTTTNEFVFTWSHFVNPYSLANPALASRATNGFNVPGLFGNTTKQIPNFEAQWGGTLANLQNYPFSTGSFGGIKQVPAFYDNFTKVVGPHSLKGGFYWDTSHNSQNSNAPDNGTYNSGGTFSTNNWVADLFLGNEGNYQQQNVNVLTDTKYHQWSIWGQDSWKAARNLTINYGLRLDHVGQWYGFPNGMQVWDPNSYVNGANAPANTGLLWHAIDSKIPLSGFKSPLFYTAPRIGFAYDIFSTGKTVLRGGWATYRYQATSETASAGNGPAGSFQYQTPTSFRGYASIAAYTPPSSVAQNGSAVDAMQQGDSRAPFTNNWNGTISQALPYRSVLEVSYIGNRSGNEYLDGSNSNLYNLNNNARGAYFTPDPVLHQYVSPAAPGCSGDSSLYCAEDPNAYNPPGGFNTNHYNPLANYQKFILLTHTSWQNYNALQVSYQKQSGPVTFVTNYSFSKVLGIRDGASNNGPGNGTGVDPFNVRNNYGPLAYDHTHILNFTYNWALPRFIHSEALGMKVVGGAVNGWKISGYTTFQSGAPLQPSLTANMNTTFAGGLTVPTVAHPNLPDNSILLPNGLRAVSVNTSTWFGSNAYNALIPALSCNPLQGLHKVASQDGQQGMRFNPECFTTPAYGQQGPNIYPYIRLPNYWNSDLGIYKSFHITEVQRIEFRASATNWLNHPLGQFGLANNNDYSVNLQQQSNATCTGCVNIDSNGNATPITVTSIAPKNTNTNLTGAPFFKTGSRFVTLALKYYF